MILNCFRPSNAVPSFTDDVIDAPRSTRASRSKPSTGGPKRGVQLIRRHGSADSRSSTGSNTSNDSISRLPPCSRLSESQLEAIMMPVPPEARPSRCLRLSQPKTYGAIIDGMKSEKGCRDWRSFAVFHNDDVDLQISAVEIAEKRAADYQRKMSRLNSSLSTDSINVDMIG